MITLKTQKSPGANSNPDSRYVEFQREPLDDGWAKETDASFVTQVLTDTSRTIITRNQSPDVPFDRSINTYKGCERLNLIITISY